MTTNQKIEASREVRQWIKGIIVPAVIGTIYVDYRYPDLKHKIVGSIKERFSKKGSGE